MKLPEIQTERDFFEYASTFCQHYRYGGQAPVNRNFVQGLYDRLSNYIEKNPSSSKFVNDCMSNWNRLKRVA